jgi:hypothetical protein
MHRLPMYHHPMTRQELAAFVASLAIPEERREVVLAELLDHFDNAARDGIDPAFGDLGELRARLERVEPAFRFGVVEAIARALLTNLALGAAVALASSIRLPVVHGASLAALLAKDFLPLLPGLLASPIVVLATPLAVRARLRRFVLRDSVASPLERRQIVRASWPAMIYVALVTLIPMYTLVRVGEALDSNAVTIAFAAPCMVGFLALLAGSLRVRGSVDRRISD